MENEAQMQNSDDGEGRDVEWDSNLKQDDISDLLGFDLSAEEGEDRSGLRALINSAFVSHRRMPMLDVVFDRAARQMTTSLRHLTNDNAEVALDDISALRFGEFIQSVPSPSIIGVLRVDALSNYCLIAVDGPLVFSIVDLLLGGKRGGTVLNVENRDFTQIEIGLIEKVLLLLVEDLAAAFSPVTELSFVLERIETTPRFAAIAQDASVCAHAKFRIDVDDRGGRAAVLFPHATLEPVQKILRREFISEACAGEDAWRDALLSGVSASRVDLKAVIAEKEMTVAALAKLKKGHTIEFGAASGETAEIRAGSLALARGRVGKQGDTIALQLAGQAIKELPAFDGEASPE